MNKTYKYREKVRKETHYLNFATLLYLEGIPNILHLKLYSLKIYQSSFNNYNTTCMQVSFDDIVD